MTARLDRYTTYFVLIGFSLLAIYPMLSILFLAFHRKSDLVTGFSLHDDRGTAVRNGQEGFEFFGYAINADPKHLPTGLLSADHSKYERTLMAALNHTGYYDIRSLSSEAEMLLMS